MDILFLVLKIDIDFWQRNEIKLLSSGKYFNYVLLFITKANGP